MVKIDALAVSQTGPVRTKTDLRNLIKADAASVKVIPAVPTPLVIGAQPVGSLPLGVPVTVHSPATTHREWTAEVERKENGTVVVR
jgi:hypothetical protein